MLFGAVAHIISKSVPDSRVQRVCIKFSYICYTCIYNIPEEKKNFQKVKETITCEEK